MFESLRNILHIKELRNKILVTLGLIAVYRLGCFLPTPGVDGGALSQFFNEMSSRQAGGTNMLGFANLFTGGALGRMSIFALGTMPYISASIIMQLLTVVIPSLEKLSKEGKTGHEKITQYSRFLTLALASLQGFFLSLWLQSKDAFMGYTIVPYPGLVFQLSTVATLCCGTLLVMWLGEQIQERGIGNGISILICAGILDRVPSAVYQIGNLYSQHLMSTFTLVALLTLWAAVMVAVVMFSQAQRRITINYARRMVGKKVYGGQTTYLPIKVDMSGIIAIIFAGSVLSFPSTLAMFMKQSDKVTGFISFFQNQGVAYNLVYVALIVFFMFFYTAIVFNPVEIANNLKKHGGFIPGVRPGDNTAKYLDTVTTRLVFCGALYVCAIAILPTLIMKNFGIKSHDVASFFGGTSVLIYVGVMLDTLRQIEGQLILHNYDGFLKMGRLQGRR